MAAYTASSAPLDSHQDSDAGTTEGMEEETSVDLDFRVVKPKKQAQRKKRKVREESVDIEELSTRVESSSDGEHENSTFGTPRSKPPDLKVYISPIDTRKSLKNINLITVARDIQKCCGSPPEFLKPTKDGIMVKCTNQKQRQKLLESQSIGNVHVKAREEGLNVKGVISGVPIEMSDIEIQTELKKQKVSHAKRIMRNHKKQNQSKEEKSDKEAPTPTRSVILAFEKAELPEEVTLCFQKFSVKQYIPPVVRCFHCQRFGHTIKNCRAKQRCVRCGEMHTFDQCQQKDDPKCVNCGGKHSAAYNGCKMAKKAQEIQKIKVVNTFSYAQAARQWQEKEEKTQITHSQPNQLGKDSRRNTTQTVTKKNEVNKSTSAPVPPNQNKQVDVTEQNRGAGIQQAKDTTIPRQPEPEAHHSVRKNEEPTEWHSNFFMSASSEDIIGFMIQVIQTFIKDKSESELRTIITTIAQQFLPSL
ncbi:uncharacterized protein [Diadema antillarum]|uniref:uncharacterized protein n=1 Tax=Diadema antillarum TaxID=105358 RepID=UPI003A89F272